MELHPIATLDRTMACRTAAFVVAVVALCVTSSAAFEAQAQGSIPILPVRLPTSSSSPPTSCSDGAYRRSWGPWRPGCPGFVLCEKGFYCEDLVQKPCLPGHYGAEEGMAEATCSGQCDAGHYCRQVFNNDIQLLQGSTTPHQNRCGSAAVYCTKGSVDPVPVSAGYYTTSSDGGNSAVNNATRDGQLICEVGHFCVDGIKEPCPAGRYGETEGLTSPECSGVCQKGYYCPSGSVSDTQVECKDREEYCPSGSGQPSPVFFGTDNPTGGTGGYYSVGDIDVEGAVEAGGQDGQIICPLGHYCQSGRKYACPPGRYGAERGMTSELCSGECEAGFYCPAASVSPRERRCGSKTVFCKPGAFAPTQVSAGFYSTGGAFDTRTGQAQCQPGAWCSAGERLLCSKGRYGSTAGLDTPDCSGPCLAGYYCDAGSNTPKQHECGSPELFCPEGSYEPRTVYTGYYTVRVEAGATVETTTGEEFQHPASLTQFQPDALNKYPPDTVSSSASTVASTILSEIRLDTSNIRTGERMCEEGFYCVDGVRRPCPAGLFGNSRRLFDAQCSGNCSAGYYCPEASTRPDQIPCGSSSVYCPPGSVQPTPVQEGYYTVGGMGPITRSDEAICEPGTWCEGGVVTSCPAGSYGATHGLSSPSCSGKCEAGYYCPTGSTSPVQIPCGDHTVFCPAGSARPVPVSLGSYTAGGRNEFIPATQGMYCRARYGVLDTAEALYAPLHIEFDEARFCTGGQIGDNNTRSTQINCEPGYFCVNGLRYECPPATYGSAPSLSDPQCTGTCPAGWYCPWASTSPFERECGGPHVYCPELSGSPTPVDPGFYTATDRSPNIRTRQVVCEPGFYCVSGQRFPCPARRFGATLGLTNALCSGICAAGHFCPEQSISDKQRQCGRSDLYCPVGSQAPLPVAQGFYTIGGDEQIEGRPQNTTRDWQLICEPGHYCEGGIKRQCPARVYGEVAGVCVCVWCVVGRARLLFVCQNHSRVVWFQACLTNLALAYAHLATSALPAPSPPTHIRAGRCS